MHGRVCHYVILVHGIQHFTIRTKKKTRTSQNLKRLSAEWDFHCYCKIFGSVAVTLVRRGRTRIKFTL